MELSRRQFLERLVLAGVSASAAGAVLAACSDDKPKPGPQNLRGRIQVLTGFSGTHSTDQLAVQQALVEAFVRVNPDVGVDFIRAASPVEAAKRLTSLIDIGKPPDLVFPIDEAGMARFVDQEMWLDLRDRLRDDEVVVEDFPAPVQPAAKAEPYFGVDSKRIVGVPVGVHTTSLAYNADLFSRVGGPTPPGSSEPTWRLDTTFLDTARRLTSERSGQFGVGHFTPELSFLAYDGSYFDPVERRAGFASSEAAAGLQFARNLEHSHRVQAPEKDELAAWRAGKVGMIELCSCDAATVLNDLPFTAQLAALPAGPTRRPASIDVQLGAIVAESKQHDLAWRLLSYLSLDKDTAAKVADGFGLNPLAVAEADAGAATSARSGAWMPAFTKVRDLIDTAFSRVRAGTSPAEVLPTLQRDAQRAIDAWFKDNKLP